MQALLRVRQEQLSGALTASTPLETWVIFTYLGRVLYISGGTASARRWQQCVSRYLPTIDTVLNSLTAAALREAFPDAQDCQEYQVLCHLQACEQVARADIQQCITTLCEEALFEIASAEAVVFSHDSQRTLVPRLALLNVADLMAAVGRQHSQWQGQNPRIINAVPRLAQPELLREQISAAMFGQWQALLSQGATIRELAYKLNKPAADVAKLLAPLLRQAIVQLEVPITTRLPITPDPIDEAPAQAPLIACIDDSEVICASMEQLLTGAGYRCLGIQDPIRAITQLLKEPPDLIFLDLVMPTTNGYELCAQLRRIPRFQNTPIIILTGNDGIIDRVRAKFVGSDLYLTKPVEPVTLLETVETYLTLKT